MSIKNKVFAAAATLTLVGGVGAVGAMSASAATPSCNFSCVDIFSRVFGTHHHPGFALDVWRQGARTGQPIILFRTSNMDPAEDFTVAFQGLVSDFNAAGMVSNAVDLHYGGGATGFPDDAAWEVEYAPYGVDSGLCVGLATTAIQGEGVTLQPCGASSKTVWIADTGQRNSLEPGGDSPATVGHGYIPVINGSDNNFSHPFVLTYPKNGFPTDIPRPQLTVTNLTGFSGNHLIPVLGTVADNQLWGAVFGELR